MPEDAAPAQSPQELESELNKSRESAARLLDNLARKIGASRAVHNAAGGLHRAAHYVHGYSAKDVVTGIERLMRRRPGYSIALAVVAGFVIGRAIRSR